MRQKQTGFQDFSGKIPEGKERLVPVQLFFSNCSVIIGEMPKRSEQGVLIRQE